MTVRGLHIYNIYIYIFFSIKVYCDGVASLALLVAVDDCSLWMPTPEQRRDLRTLADGVYLAGSSPPFFLERCGGF